VLNTGPAAVSHIQNFSLPSVALSEVIQWIKDLEIPWHMEAAHILTIQRDNMIDVATTRAGKLINMVDSLAVIGR